MIRNISYPYKNNCSNNNKLFSLNFNININNKNYIKSTLPTFLKKKNNNNNNNENESNTTNTEQQQHINKPSISKEDSLFNIFEKYEFNKRKLSNQTIWLPFLKTQNYNFNPLHTSEKDIYHHNYDIKLLDTFKQLLTKELRLLNNNKEDQESSELFKVEKSLLITENNNSNIDKLITLFKSPNDFLDNEKSNLLKNYLEKSIYNVNQIVDSGSNSSNNNNNQSIIWSQQILPNSYRIKRSPNTPNSELVNECFNYLYPLLSYLHYIYNDNFVYTIHSITNCREDDSNENELKLKVRKIRKSLENKIETTRKRIYKQQLTKSQHDTFGISFNNIINLNGLKEVIDGEGSGNNKKNLFIIQLLLTSETNDLYISIGKSLHSDGKGWSFPLPFQQGVVPIERDQIPPSRAYKKLIESFQLLGTVPLPRSVIVELGGSPGGWTSVLNRLYTDDDDDDDDQLEIHSIDRSKLDSQFKDCKNIYQYQSNGMKWLPTTFLKHKYQSESTSKPIVNWLLNDMAIPPKQSLETLEKWIKDKHTEYFIWAIKFTGDEDYKPTITSAYKLMEKYNITNFKIKHLIYQGNEIMIMGKI